MATRADERAVARMAGSWWLLLVTGMCLVDPGQDPRRRLAHGGGDLCDGRFSVHRRRQPSTVRRAPVGAAALARGLMEIILAFRLRGLQKAPV
jgi:hypothetical protein